MNIKKSKNSQVLILTYLFISVLIAVSTSLLFKAVNKRNTTLRQRQIKETFYLAEGAIEYAIDSFREAIANFQISPDIQNYDVEVSYQTLNNFTVEVNIQRKEDTDRIVIENGTYVYVRNYEIIAEVAHPENSSISLTLHQIIARRLIPAFQHAVFYNNDLEILPGPNMTLSGRIHSNHDIYIDSNNTLTVDSFYLHSAGDIFNRRKDQDRESPGDVRIRVDKPGSPQYEYMNGLDSDDPNWTQESQDRWRGTVQTAVHGVTELTTPSVGSIDSDGYYANQADVVIINDTIYKNGETLVEGVDYPTGAITHTTTFYNNREGKYVKMTEIDLRKLAGYAEGDPEGSPSFPNNLPSNGLIYATRTDSGNYQPGIRLKNGEKIYREGGLTTVTNQPLYIQGDYNTQDSQPSAIIADALNILSNNWNDSNSTQNLSQRTASETTINCAFIAGIDETTPGHYNGGLENYPRLHEKWSGVNLNIYGSFVALWESQVAQGAWHYGNPQYQAPIRNWHYNTLFDDPANLPPFTPWAVEAQRIAWWKE